MPFQTDKTFIFFLLHLFIFLARPHTLQPQLKSRIPPLADASDANARRAINPRLDGSCDDAQQRQLLEAWDGAGILANAHTAWEPTVSPAPGSPQAVMDVFLGTDSRDDASAIGTIGGEGPLRQNVLRQHGIHFAGPRPIERIWTPEDGSVDVTFYCDERRVPDGIPPGRRQQLNKCARNPEINAYSWEVYGHGPNLISTVFCPRFFTENYDLSTLERAADAGERGFRNSIRPWRKTRARIVLHETYHWSPEVSVPKCDYRPERYSMWLVTKLAIDENTGGMQPGDQGARLNAESWAQAALAIYVLQRYPSEKVPLPPFRRQNPQKRGNVTGGELETNSTQDYLQVYTNLNTTELSLNMTSLVRMSDVRKRFKMPDPYSSNGTRSRG